MKHKILGLLYNVVLSAVLCVGFFSGSDKTWCEKTSEPKAQAASPKEDDKHFHAVPHEYSRTITP